MVFSPLNEFWKGHLAWTHCPSLLLTINCGQDGSTFGPQIRKRENLPPKYLQSRVKAGNDLGPGGLLDGQNNKGVVRSCPHVQ